MKFQLPVDTIRKHMTKITLVGAVIISVWLASSRVLLITLPYLESLQFVHFVLLIASVGGIFFLYRRKNQPWIFIIATTSALFNYFFVFVLGSTFGVYITAVGLLVVLVWNVILDRTSDVAPELFPASQAPPTQPQQSFPQDQQRDTRQQ